jgi:hypothetical protein
VSEGVGHGDRSLRGWTVTGAGYGPRLQAAGAVWLQGSSLQRANAGRARSACKL